MQFNQIINSKSRGVSAKKIRARSANRKHQSSLNSSQKKLQETS